MTTPWLVAAERSLIAGQFNRAAQNAESVLRNGGVAEDKDYGIRAAFVLLQALYELNRSLSPPPPPSQPFVCMPLNI